MCVHSGILWCAPDHSDWTALLKKYTKAEGPRTVVNYTDWKKTGQGSLDQYLGMLSGFKKKDFEAMMPSDQLAFLINAYNAFTVKLILDYFPITSIKEAGSLFQSPWKKKFFKLFGEMIHLDYLEHELIRKIYKEPRIHFAVNCASHSCPELKREAFEGPVLEAQLKEVEKSFFLDPSKMSFSGNKVMASKILDWYGEDFSTIYGSVAAYILKKGHEFNRLSSDIKKVEVEFSDYNWKLNGN